MHAIKSFRLVAQNNQQLAEFYRAIGFEIGTPVPIAPEDMALLGLTGQGTRLPMKLGPSAVDLDTYDHPGQPYPAEVTGADTLFQHLALVTTDIRAAWTQAIAAGATPISRNGPIQLPASSGSVIAAKFRDPEGHPLEFLQFPAGSNPAWPGTGTLGIDHSAISVADTTRAIAFYERHGLTLGPRGTNTGPTQVALDDIDNVTVQIVPMLPSRTPAHLELLGYRNAHPRNPWNPNDIAATRIVWHADQTALLRDEDGHLHQLQSAQHS